MRKYGGLGEKVTLHFCGAGPERVVVALGDGRFKSVEVRSGRESEGLVEIREGLSLFDQVVVSGQFLIDSESNFSRVVERLEGNNPNISASGAAP